jgi:hypothetical protein
MEDVSKKRGRSLAHPVSYKPGDRIETRNGAGIILTEKVGPGRWRATATCPDCPPDQNQRDLHSVYTTPSRLAEFTGLCLTHSANRRRVYAGEELDPSGAVILWGQRAPGSRQVPYICCGRDVGEHRAYVDFFQLSRQRQDPRKFGNWSGRCKPCRQRASVATLSPTLVVNGIKVRRDPARSGYGWITCPDSIGPDCLKESYVKLNLAAYKTGRRTGRCKPCGYFRRSGGRGDKLPLTGAPVFLDQRRGDRVPVKCVYAVPENEGGICGTVHETNIKSLRRRWDYATGFCPRHETLRYGGNSDTYCAAVRALVLGASVPRPPHQRGGARNVKWTPDLRAQFLAIYEAVLEKVQNRDSSLPERVRHQASLRGNKPSDVARHYAAESFGAKSGDYLQRVLAQARRERVAV